MRKAYDIDWSIESEEIFEILDAMTVEKAAEALAISKDRYAAMTTEERHDYAYDMFHHHRLSAAEFAGLPDEVELPPELGDAEEDAITEWLSDTYGYFLNGYRLNTDPV